MRWRRESIEAFGFDLAGAVFIISSIIIIVISIITSIVVNDAYCIGQVNIRRKKESYK